MPKTKDKKTGKYKPYTPTDKERGEVLALISFGNTHEDIATYLGISPDTLQRKFRREIDTGAIRANAKVAGCLFNRATVMDDVSAQIFWLKTRGRWRTADTITAVESNERLREELRELREQLDAKNKKAY